MNENTYYGSQPTQSNYNPQYAYNMQMRQALARQEGNPYYQQPAISAPLQNYIKGRPVVSIEEARASQIDLDGSLYVFTDLGNKKIYTKQINLDGTASLNTYVLSEEVVPKTPEYVTKDEFRETLAQLQQAWSAAAAQKEKPTFNI